MTRAMNDMNQNWEQMEQDAGAGIDAIGASLETVLPRDVAERARLAARVALDERWLATQEASALPSELRDRLTALVHRELANSSPASLRRSWWQRHDRGLSALASAAMIGICVGVIHHAGTLSSNRVRPANTFDQFMQTGEEVADADPLTSDLSDDLDDLEDSMARWPTESDRIEDNLQQLDEMIDTLQLDSVNGSETL